MGRQCDSLASMSAETPDLTPFEQHAQLASQAYRTGQFDQADTLWRGAFALAEEASRDAGNAARNVAACQDKLGNSAEAERWANSALAIHTRLLADDLNSPDAWRERGASAMYVGIVILRRTIQAQLRGQHGDIRAAREAIDMAQFDFYEANYRTDRQLDQYQINLARRISALAAVQRDRPRGLRWGWDAFRLATQSESPELDTTNHDLTAAERKQAQHRARIGALAAIGANLTANGPRPVRRLSLHLAARAL